MATIDQLMPLLQILVYAIEHIGWYWESHSINGVNKQSVRLTLYLRGLKKTIFLKKTTMFFTSKLVIAYNYIAKETFQNRLGFYLKQLEHTGGFYYGKHIIYSDGRVYADSKTFNLLDATFEPFQLKIKQGGIFSPSVKIGLGLDKDVIITLFDFILKKPQSPDSYVESHKFQKESKEKSWGFLSNTVSLMAKLSKADGHISTQEIDVVTRFLKESLELQEDAFNDAVKIFNTAKSSPDSFEFHAQNLVSQFGSNKGILSPVLEFLFAIAIADGILSAEEELLLLEAESIFDFKGESFHIFKNKAPKSTSTKRLSYLQIFGLPSNATTDEIRIKYKRLAMNFHPDRVYHLGDEFVKEAEVKMKEINAAYEYLCKKSR